MVRLRVRIKDKRICGLVKAFLKSGIFTELGDRDRDSSKSRMVFSLVRAL